MFYTNVARYGKNILFRGYTSSGKAIKRKVEFKPTLYVETPEETEWKSLYGHNLKPRKQKGMKEAAQFIDKYGDVENMQVFGNTNYVAQFITEAFPGKIEYDRKHIRIGNFDIEVYSEAGFPEPADADHPVTSIAYKDSKKDHYNVWSTKKFDVEKSNYNSVFVYCETEEELLRKFIEFIKAYTPDIVTGWNLELFDIPYLINRISKLLGDRAVKELSPWGIVNYRAIWHNDKEQDAYEIVGISQLDYMSVFKKYGYSYGPQESYSLDNIAHVLLGEKKLSYEEYGSLFKLWVENPQKYIEYNLRDVDLVDQIDKETCLIDILLSVAYKAGSNYKDTLGTVGIWDSIVYRKLLADKIVVPFPKSHEKVKYPGGYVKEPQLGKHEWVVSFDLASLYPSIIAQNNMSPEKLVDDGASMPRDVDYYLDTDNVFELDSNHAVCANGVKFERGDLGVIPRIIVDYFAERQEVKKEMIRCQNLKEEAKTEEERDSLDHDINLYDNQQMTIKILMNSLYGAMGNIYFRFYDLRIAEGITLTGQLAIKWAERAANQEMNKLLGTTDVDYVIAIDTDSLYINMSGIVEKHNPSDPASFLSNICEKHFEKVINGAYEDLFKRLNSNLSRLDMEREVIADRGIWTAKKHYILNVLDKEGVRYTDPKLKIMGIQAIKSSTPGICRTALKEGFKIIMNGEEEDLKKFVGDFKAEFKSSGPEVVASPRGVSNIEKWMDTSKSSVNPFKKGTPIHAKGSIMYNKALKEKGLDNQYELIKSGEKIKYCYMKMPNPLRVNVICFPNYLPKELDLEQYIDYNTLFEKNFKAIMRSVTEKIGWDIDTTATLDEFWV